MTTPQPEGPDPNAIASWPDGLLLSYYGDDFTGSTDVMEAFTAAGVPTVLFLSPPRPEDLNRFKQMRCVGVAGLSRSQSPAWMQQHLPEAFESLAALKAPILQYKVCSTFDSSPTAGSIGQAVDLGVKCAKENWSPMIVGAPRLQRYQVFGNLFAAAVGEVYRIDRHPTMSRHPVTPMDEADLRLHLGKQTERQIGLIDIAQIAAGTAQQRLDSLRSDARPVVMVDVADASTQQEAGRLVWENRGQGLFSASSSGLQYALAAYWRSLGLLPAQPSLPATSKTDCIAVASGSCSPMSAAQIDWARDNGFHTARLDIASCLDAVRWATEVERHVRNAVAQLLRGVSPVIYSAQGPDDPAVTEFDATAKAAGFTREQAARKIGETLAEIMRQILDRSPVTRIVVAGGDSSGAVASHLGITALTVASALAPGAPLCRAWSRHKKRDGLEIVLKGGQLGAVSFYGTVRDGVSDSS